MRGIISAGGQRLSRDYRRRLQKKVWLTNKATWPGRPRHGVRSAVHGRAHLHGVVLDKPHHQLLQQVRAPCHMPPDQDMAHTTPATPGRWLLGTTDFRFPLTYTTTNKIIGWFLALMVLCLSVATGKGEFPPAARLRAQFKRPMIHIHGVFTVRDGAYAFHAPCTGSPSPSRKRTVASTTHTPYAQSNLSACTLECQWTHAHAWHLMCAGAEHRAQQLVARLHLALDQPIATKHSAVAHRRACDHLREQAV